MPPTSPAYGGCSAIIFNKPSSRDATAVCGTVCKPPRQAYVILLDVDCGGSDLIVDRPKAPTKTNYIHHAPFSFHSHSGIRWGESATLKLSESLLIRWVRDWLVITLSPTNTPISEELDHRAYYFSILRGLDTSPQTTSTLGNKQIGFVVPV